MVGRGEIIGVREPDSVALGAGDIPHFRIEGVGTDLKICYRYTGVQRCVQPVPACGTGIIHSVENIGHRLDAVLVFDIPDKRPRREGEIGVAGIVHQRVAPVPETDLGCRVSYGDHHPGRR